MLPSRTLAASAALCALALTFAASAASATVGGAAPRRSSSAAAATSAARVRSFWFARGSGARRKSA